MKHVDAQCAAFQTAIKILGKPWNALVLTQLQQGPKRFSELSGPGDKLLSARLKELEANGLVLRRVHDERPVRVSYTLTKQGRAFSAVAAAIETWGRGLAK